MARMARPAPTRAPGITPTISAAATRQSTWPSSAWVMVPGMAKSADAHERRRDGRLHLHAGEVHEGRDHDHAAADAEQARQAAGDHADGGEPRRGVGALRCAGGRLGRVGLGERLVGRAAAARRGPSGRTTGSSSAAVSELQQVAVAGHVLGGDAADHRGRPGRPAPWPRPRASGSGPRAGSGRLPLAAPGMMTGQRGADHDERLEAEQAHAGL